MLWYFSVIFSHAYFCSVVFLAFSPILCIMAGLFSRWRIFSARALGCAGGVRMPVLLFCMISLAPPWFVAITGLAQLMASMMVFPKGSPWLGKQ